MPDRNPTPSKISAPIKILVTRLGRIARFLSARIARWEADHAGKDVTLDDLGGLIHDIWPSCQRFYDIVRRPSTTFEALVQKSEVEQNRWAMRSCTGHDSDEL